ncbi:MAG TPA: 1,4-dihydroxy-2-naphthoate polyprenyltransferase [Thermoanaerobaculia bacterium]
MKNWLLAARPKTLSAAIVPVLMATALAAHQPTGIVWPIAACALAGAILIQIATNFINDALDFKKGADTGERIGPIRVVQAGLIHADAVLTAAYVCLFLAAMCGVPLLLRGGWPLLAIGLASIVMAYAYTGGPYPLAYHGLGELFVLLFFGFAAVGGTYYVQTLTIDPAVLLTGFAAGALATVLLVINNLRDVATDRVSRKRTLAVRFGPMFARAEVVFFALVPFFIAGAVAWHRSMPWLLVTLAALPLALLVIVRVLRADGPALNKALAMAGALQWAFGLLFVLGTVL